MTAEQLPQPEIESQQAFTEFVFKLSSQCNMQPPTVETASLKQLPLLAQGVSVGCDQCYEYAGTDAWKEQPLFMSPEVILKASERIAEHAEANAIRDIRIIAHGGEPLMYNARQLDSFATTVRQTIRSDYRNVHLSIQTNGLLLTEQKLWVLQKHGFSVGLSLDGNKVANDRHRRDKLGRSTYDRVARAARMLSESSINWGFIMVIDTLNDPEACLEAAAAFKPQSIKLHPQHANWSSPPVSKPNALSLGEWQSRIFARYLDWNRFHPDEQAAPFTMPLIDDYIDSFLGAQPTDERVANRYPHELFFLPNGNMQRLDTLKTTEAGAHQMRFNVFEHSLNEVASTDPGFIARRMGDAALAKECLSCELLEQCGGDYYPLRFKQTIPLDEKSTADDFAEAFRNPSIYCDDQKQYLGRIAAFVNGQKRALAELPVDIHDVWYGWRHYHDKGKSDSEYNKGTFGSHDTLPPSQNVSYYMGAFDVAAGLMRVFDPIVKHPDPHQPPEISYDTRTQLWWAIHDKKYAGLGALLALEKIVEQDFVDDTLYFQPGPLSRGPTGAFRTAEDLCTDKTDAVMHALFNPGQHALRDVNYKYARLGDNWLVTKNAIEAHARYIDLPSTSFVTPLLFLSVYDEQLHKGQLTSEAQALVAEKLPCITPVSVTLRDMPHNVLVIDAPGGTASDTINAFNEAAMLLTRYDPEHVSKLLADQDLAVNLTPITKHW